MPAEWAKRRRLPVSTHLAQQLSESPLSHVPLAGARGLDRRSTADLPDTEYFHVVFTVPQAVATSALRTALQAAFDERGRPGG